MIRIRFTAALLAAVLLLALVGCNQATSARNAVERFGKAMNDNDFRTAFAYVADYDNFGFSEGSEGIINAVAASMTIEVLNESSGSTTAVIDVNITTVDLREVYRNAAKRVIPTYYEQAVSGNSISAEDVSNRLTQEVVAEAASGIAPTVKTKCSINLIKDDKGKWLIQLDTTTYYAITGYLDEANNLITTGTITQAITGGTAPTTAATQPPVSGSDTTTTTAAAE